jgi:hypothetical protein
MNDLDNLREEFSETLCLFWERDRDAIKTGAMRPALLYTLLDALCTVVLPVSTTGGTEAS